MMKRVFFITVGPWNGEPLLMDKNKPKMQRSLSLSTVNSNARVVIRPDPSFTRFDPENDDDEVSDDDEVNQHQVKVNVRPNVVRRPRHHVVSPAMRGGQFRQHGQSLSNLTAVSETPLTACAVSQALENGLFNNQILNSLA